MEVENGRSVENALAVVEMPIKRRLGVAITFILLLLLLNSLLWIFICCRRLLLWRRRAGRDAMIDNFLRLICIMVREIGL